MQENTKNLISITEANKNSSKTEKMVDEDVMRVAKKVITKNLDAFKKLAK